MCERVRWRERWVEGVEGDKSREGKGRRVERRVVRRTGKTKEEGRKKNIGVRGG